MMDLFATTEVNVKTNPVSETQDAECKAYAKFIMHSVVAGSVCLLGFIGNSVSCFVLLRDKAAPVASFMLQALAFADNFFLCLWFLHFSIADLLLFYKWDLNNLIGWQYLRLYTYPILFIGQTTTIWMTVLIAVSRYIAVCKPYKAAQMCTIAIVKKGVFAVIAFSVLYNVPRYFETRIYETNMDKGHNMSREYEFKRTEFGESHAYQLIYFDIAYYLTCFGVPLAMLAVLNMKLTMSYRLVVQRKRVLFTRSMQQDTCDHNITLVLILVILAFMLCNTPARIVQIVWRYKPQKCLSTAFLLIEISNVLEVLNSSINFIIYCVFRRQFREILTQTMCGNSSKSEKTIEPRYADVQTQVNSHFDDGASTSMIELTEYKDRNRSDKDTVSVKNI